MIKESMEIHMKATERKLLIVIEDNILPLIIL